MIDTEIRVQTFDMAHKPKYIYVSNTNIVLTFYIDLFHRDVMEVMTRCAIGKWNIKYKNK